MISAYVNCGCASDALDIYTEMRRTQVAPDSFTISNALIACSMIGLFYLGTMIHGELMKRPLNDNLAVPSALLTMYSRLGSLEDAYRVFIQMKEKDVVAWGSMISGSL
ncbi:UNVERIFIED_CONTAM: Pentatricopeptide repeat-containing protein [Sesamum radiatum]|uniref:Pentatricopeptide repeat-containing protein n=1 Tax=Sesamum radiatum TaxID=300843 RepID=A0AAW2IHF5_SESRA